MSVVFKRSVPAVQPAAKSSPWMHIVWCGAAVLFVSILALTYGLDLSPGLF